MAVDEASNNPYMRVFASAFQILIHQDLPLFLVVTGLYDNIRMLQDERSLTFLYRAPRIEVGPLNLGAAANNYRKNFDISDQQALDMARITCGYSFAFQVLGYFAWEHDGLGEEALSNFKQYLNDYAYEKIWSELSANDRLLAFGIASSPTEKVADVRKVVGWDSNHFNPYRDRLVKRGIVDGSLHGHVRFMLPLFDRYVLEHYDAFEPVS